MVAAPSETESGGTAVMFGIDSVEFVIADNEPVGQGTHVAFRVETRALVDAFYAAALAAGGRDNGAPGIRAQYSPTYYAAFVHDPDGINVEAVRRLPSRPGSGPAEGSSQGFRRALAEAQPIALGEFAEMSEAAIIGDRRCRIAGPCQPSRRLASSSRQSRRNWWGVMPRCRRKPDCKWRGPIPSSAAMSAMRRHSVH